MGELLAYSGIVTKVRAMQKNFITEDEFREIAELPDVPSVVAWLKKNPAYENALAHLDEQNLHRDQIEFEIENASLRDFAELYSFANQTQRGFLKRYGRRFEVKFLKRVMNAAFSGTAMNEHIKLYKSFFDRFTELDLEKLYESKDMPTILSSLKSTSYYAPLYKVSQNANAVLFDYETALDQFYFNTIWKDKGGMKKPENVKTIEKVFGTKFDLLNLWWINRARKYFHMSAADIYAMLIPIPYKLKSEDVKTLVEADSDDTYKAALGKTYYGRVYGNYLSPSNLENEYTYLLHHILGRISRSNPYSIASLYNYLYLKEHEIVRLTVAIECVRYGMSADEAMPLIKET